MLRSCPFLCEFCSSVGDPLLNVFVPRSQSLDIHPNGSQALIGLSTGEAQIVSIAQLDGGGAAVTEKTYSNTSTTSLPPGAGYGAAFAANGQAVIFGSVDGCALVWDTKKSAVVYALEHEEGGLLTGWMFRCLTALYLFR